MFFLIGVATPLRMGSELKSSEEEELDKLLGSPLGSHPFAPGKRVGFPHAGFSKEVILTLNFRAKNYQLGTKCLKITKNVAS